VRWNHPKLGLLRPADFLDVALEIGEIGRIGRWVARSVCRDLAKIRQVGAGPAFEYLSFNLDARELGYHDFPAFLEEEAARHSVALSELVLEITETSLIDNFDQIRELIDRLHRGGVRWAIDDFGTGYSSLSYLQRLSLDHLKIDRSFTQTLDGKEDPLLIRHILEIARHLGYTVIVEGVETKEQLRRLRRLSGEIYAQGFFFDGPLPFEKLLERLQRPDTYREMVLKQF
jgi:EAL domain-containing protein (putative c-di-GMP-specific phosphodiesterase class I)